MKLKLSAKAGDAGQRGNSRQFPALMAQMVTGKEVREKMFLQKSIDDRRKKLVTAGRGDGVPAAELRPYPVSYTHLDVYKRQPCHRVGAGWEGMSPFSRQ